MAKYTKTFGGKEITFGFKSNFFSACYRALAIISANAENGEKPKRTPIRKPILNCSCQRYYMRKRTLNNSLDTIFHAIGQSEAPDIETIEYLTELDKYYNH